MYRPRTQQAHEPVPRQAAPDRRKPDTGTITLVSAFAVVGVLIGMLAVVDSRASAPPSVADSGYDYPAPSAAPPTPSTPTTTTTPSGPKPVPRTKDNPLFAGDHGTNTVTCNLPQWRSTQQAAQAFFTAAMPCVEAAWAPVMQRANLPFVRPKVVFPTGTRWDSACGGTDLTTQEASATYCRADGTIYMPFAGLQTDAMGSRIGVYLSVFAHEYGHHIQALSGVLEAAHDERYQLGTNTPAGLELQRRVELQAQCFGGMWFAAAWNGKGSITDQVVSDMLATGYRRGDDNNPDGPRDHGKNQNYGAWQQRGYEKNRTYECNTYLAPANSVS